MRFVLTLLWAVACVLVCGACAEDSLLYLGSWVEPEAPLRLEPLKFKAVSLELRNRGTATWKGGEVYVTAQELPEGWGGGTLNLVRETKPGAVGLFRGNLSPGSSVGSFQARWAVLTRGLVFGELLETAVESTCSDEVFCNGEERFANGRCVAGANPCQDTAQCTGDVCDEQTRTCRYTPTNACDGCRSTCIPDCTERVCGDDGCGGTCGACPGETQCVASRGKCEPQVACEPLRPTCPRGCAATEFCGTDCQCHPLTAPQPDLLVNEERLKSELRFDTVVVSEDSCAWAERCVTGTGERRVLRFSVEAVNQGLAPLVLPTPDERPELFAFAPCHTHLHFEGFATYALLDREGRAVITRSHPASCIQDTERVSSRPDVSCSQRYSCEAQGLQSGWSALQASTLECQWLDITGVAPGDYWLRVTLNPERALQEATLENNTTSIQVSIPAP